MTKFCLHCQNPLKKEEEKFCCLGCDAAHKIINKLGFGNYYDLRQLNQSEHKIKPEAVDEIDISEFATDHHDGSFSASLIVQGLHCAACVWLIESILRKQKNVLSARINLSKKTLFLRWSNKVESGNKLIGTIAEIGYKLLPFDEEILKTAEKKYNDRILRALAVAGFGAGNIMLFSFSLWFANGNEMGSSTRNLLHFFSSLVALPVIIYSARPFFSSALKSIKSGFPNMDLAISIAISLACLISLLEIFRGKEHAYFDSAVMLIFFLLIGRYLDLQARKKAFNIASEFTMLSASFGRIEDDKKVKIIPSKNLHKDMILLVAAGEKIAADGIVINGDSEIDNSLISGESLPNKVVTGSEVFAGTINLTAPLKIKITKSPQNSLITEIISLSNEVENKKNHYVKIADRLAKLYLPAVHILSFATFLLWIFLLKSDWEIALMTATSVLIITCPCALALAVPIVQTIAISNFIKKGILVKSGEALEKLPSAEIFVFDKTGSLTVGQPSLREIFKLKDGKKIALTNDEKNFFLKLAASLAKNSKHPISSALIAAFNEDLLELTTKENQGFGLEATFENHRLKLGRKDFCDIKNDVDFDENFLVSFMKFDEEELIFLFEEKLKQDANLAISNLQKFGKKVILLSGDNKKSVETVAKELQILEFYPAQTPLSKMQFLENLKTENKKFVMIGDGLNDAPALALSDISVSFSRASDISQNIADIIVQGEKLMPIIELINSAKKADALMKQNLFLALIYNLIAIPFAVAGLVIPLIAAVSMSSSSLLVLLNSLRMSRN